MTEYKVTIAANGSAISYTVYKTENGAKSFGAKVAKEAFYGEDATVTVEAQ